MHCGEFVKSSWDRFEGQDNDVLKTMAQRYMSAQPAESYTYRVSSMDGLKRGLDYRYDMEMTSRFPQIHNGQYVYAWAKLWSEEDTELPFSLSCYGPVTVYVNGALAHHANIEQEVFPQQRSWFRLKLKAGWNQFVWQFMKTGTGCGAQFGSGSIKGFPLHFVVPFGAAEGAEGVIYTAPIDERKADFAHCDILASDKQLIWHPRMTWQKEELQQTAAERIFGASKGQAVLAWTSVYAKADGVYELSGTYKGKLIIMCNSEQVEVSGERSVGSELNSIRAAADEQSRAAVLNSQKLVNDLGGSTEDLSSLEGTSELSSHFAVKLSLQKGRNDVWIWMIEQDGIGVNWERLVSLEQGAAVDLTDELSADVTPVAPLQVEGNSHAFLYSGPYEQPLSLQDTIALQSMSTLHTTIEGPSYWRTDMPGGYIRPFAETSHYGRWNYPLGVTLYGLLRLEDEEALQYAVSHIESCTAFHDYSFWDAQMFGAPGINHQLVGMDSLDDCGSFGATMLYAHARQPLAGADSLAARIAHYITSEQSRLSDGTLYRIKGSTNFMKDTMWCDDLYMSVPFLVRYSLHTGEQRYIDDAIHQLLQYKEYLFESSLNIMHHVYDLKFNAQNGAFWGRGNGWVLFSLAELLRHIKADHPKRDELLLMFHELSRGYAALQGENGLWHQVLDDHESYEESSCTSMFAYAFAIGVQEGWYDEPSSYIECVRKAWEGLKKRAIDEEGNVYGVCRGSGFAHHSYYYKHELMPRLNDTHGIGIIMLAGIEAGKMNSWLEAQTRLEVRP
ncbi:glycoside hydrolase family 88/105 protein [Paenibacillus sp. FSL W7-1287]|uniref:glycoside hydrolase family 88/105 protein n=1 Tax=Paenibacillus sp. FSL W7-1287 TaxID=2954538 RepID=UPI0030F72D59